MIVSMKRMTLAAHKADEASILKALQATQSVEVIPDGEAAAGFCALEEAEARLQKLDEALKTLRPFRAKSGLLDAAPAASLSELSGVLPGALAYSERLNELSRALADTKSEIDKNESQIASLRPWETFPAKMDSLQKSERVRYFVGYLAAADCARLDELEAYTEAQFFTEGVVRAGLIACPIEEAKSVSNFLKSLNWTDMAFPKFSLTPAEAMRQMEARNDTLEEKQDQLQQALAAEAAERAQSVETAYDAALIERDRAAAAAELSRSDATFLLEGWVPEPRVDAVEQAILSVTDAYYLDVRDPGEGETPPAVVHNSRFATPFEQVTNLYSRPDPQGIDATPYMAPFYALLFGLMLSDTGYGIVLSILCALFIKLKKPTGMSGGFARVLFWGGLSTIVWGVLVGTFFGLDFDVVFGTVDRFPLLMDPLADPIAMLILCFGLGVLHILFGVSLKMKLSFSRGDWQTAMFDNFSWMLIILGLIVYGGSAAVAGLPALVGQIGMGMAGLGAVTILLFKGRAKKNPFSRVSAGLGELYQVTGYLSDILSYARLFALGIATGVIASVFNQICGMLMHFSFLPLKILGILIAVALLAGLHLFNIAINTLGAFVHCARLQYVEFYGKFYEPGGRAFRPLGYQTKHVRLTGIPVPGND